MKVKFRGRMFRVIRRHLAKGTYGECSDQCAVIRIDKRLKGWNRLNIEVHEALHACFPMLGERTIRESGWGIAGMLWKLGYRAKPRKGRET